MNQEKPGGYRPMTKVLFPRDEVLKQLAVCQGQLISDPPSCAINCRKLTELLIGLVLKKIGVDPTNKNIEKMKSPLRVSVLDPEPQYGCIMAAITFIQLVGNAAVHPRGSGENSVREAEARLAYDTTIYIKDWVQREFFNDSCEAVQSLEQINSTPDEVFSLERCFLFLEENFDSQALQDSGMGIYDPGLPRALAFWWNGSLSMDEKALCIYSALQRIQRGSVINTPVRCSERYSATFNPWDNQA
jgi:hypothetical protein